ncbi:hypothetical protein [Streptomyces nitrosporeus]
MFATFLRLREIFTWDRETSKTVIGRAIAQAAAQLVTGTQRRAK